MNRIQSLLPPVPILSQEDPGPAVQIEPSVEPLVALAPSQRLFIQPAYFFSGYRSAGERILVREGVAEALERVGVSLPRGMALLVWDGLRSLDTQREIANRFRTSLNGARVSDADLEQLVCQYVSPLPATSLIHQSAPAPHSTGGAVDLTLADEDGNALDLGTHFDDFRRVALPAHYERRGNRTDLSRESATRRLLRRVLFHAMLSAGFAPYPFEFWHFELGTRRAAAYHGHSAAKYGPAVPYLPPGPNRGGAPGLDSGVQLDPNT